MTELQRVQVLLERAQRRALAQIAKREGRSVSAVLRELVERGLAQKADERQQWRDALADLSKIRQTNRARGIYQGDLIADARAEQSGAEFRTADRWLAQAAQKAGASWVRWLGNVGK